MIDPDTQHALFLEAVELLGGVRATGRILDVADRSMSRLINRTHPLHDGFLRDIAAALTERAQRCREVERRLSPLFDENRAPEQKIGDARRFAQAKAPR